MQLYNSAMPIMPLMPHRNKKGFTLVELLLVIFLVALLATIALSSYTDSTRTLNFLGGYKQMMSSLRTARSYAITNKQVGGEIPERYGVCVSSNSIVVFADTGDKPLIFDPEADLDPEGAWGGCTSSEDAVLGKRDAIIQSYNFSEREYVIGAFADKDATGPTGQDLTQAATGFEGAPLAIFYERGGKNVIFVDENAPMGIENKFLYLKFTSPDVDVPKCATIYLLSGLAEESKCD